MAAVLLRRQLLAVGPAGRYLSRELLEVQPIRGATRRPETFPSHET